MRQTNTKGETASHDATLKCVAITLLFACAIGLALCTWISSNPDILPTPD